MRRWLRNLVKPTRHGGVWFATLAILGHLWMPVLHAQPGNTVSGMIPAELHGELCLTGGVFSAGTDSGSDGPLYHVLMDCECLTCKVLNAGILATAISTNLPMAGNHPVPPPSLEPVHAARAFSRPPSRAPPRG